MISLMPLPYASDALQPHISARTLAEHHGAHHKAYVDKVNVAIKESGRADAPLEAIIVAARRAKDNGLFNVAAQVWNHGFYWHSLIPEPTHPSSRLANAIARDFGSLDHLIDVFADEAESHFGSGWAWLTAKGGRLSVTSTHDAATPLTGRAKPLLVIDVWEHAYYLDRKSKRADYVRAVAGSCLNWNFASENFERGGPLDVSGVGAAGLSPSVYAGERETTFKKYLRAAPLPRFGSHL